jgi:putative transposase
VGIDVGIKTLATCSDGTTFENPKALVSKERQLGRLQRRHSRRKKGSNRREKTRQRMARLHYRISNIRRDAIHKATSWIVKTKRPETVVLEDLSVSGMLKNHKLARAVADASVSEFRRQIEYKADWNGVNVQLADRWFPSSKLCSECGCVKDDLKLSDRTYHCDGCGLSIDRDLNAAINLERYLPTSSAGSYAQGEGRLQGGVAAQCPSMN